MYKYIFAIIIFFMCTYNNTNADTSSQYYLNVKTPTSQINLNKKELKYFRNYLTEEVSKIENVIVVPESKIKLSNMTGYNISSIISNLETRDDGSVHAQVSISLKRIKNNKLSREYCISISGAATAPKSDITEQLAIQGAFTSALKRLPQAMSNCDGKLK